MDYHIGASKEQYTKEEASGNEACLLMRQEDILWAGSAAEKTLDKIERSIDRIGYSYPHVAPNGRWNDQGPRFWVSGFWAGILWLDWKARKNAKARDLAIRLEEGLDEVLDGFDTIHHDVGFMWQPTALAHWQDDGNDESRRRWMKAASHLAGRFNINGRFIRAWNDEVQKDCQGWAIIDCLMNMPLLYAASKQLDDPRFRHIAMAHTDTVLEKGRRKDGSYPHIMSFDPETGEKIGNLGGQGYGPDSAWARGQSWALYGNAIAYRETGEERYRDAALQVASFFVSHLNEENVSVWDFRAPEETLYAMDTSATAIASSGLLELASLLDEGADKAWCEDRAIRMLKGLEKHYAVYDDSVDGVIQKGTVHFPAGKNINVPIIYGDYYYLEALLKTKGIKGFF